MAPVLLDSEKQTFLPCPSLPPEAFDEPSLNEEIIAPPSQQEDRSNEAVVRTAERQPFARRMAFVLILMLLFSLRHYIPTRHMPSSNTIDLWRLNPGYRSTSTTPDEFTKRIPLEAHIMSKCPDARDCLRDLVVPAMEKIEKKVDFRLSFIGKTIPHEDGVSCLHGQTECLGNLLELCAAKLYPQPKTYLGFTLCLSLSYPDIPSRDLVESCALESGIDRARLEACTAGQDDGDDDDSEDGGDDDDGDGHMAWGLLKKSFQRSADANVTKSCTVRLDGEVRCIRDGGEWSDCKGGSGVGDLTADVERLFRGRNGGGRKEDV